MAKSRDRIIIKTLQNYTNICYTLCDTESEIRDVDIQAEDFIDNVIKDIEQSKHYKEKYQSIKGVYKRYKEAASNAPRMV